MFTSHLHLKIKGLEAEVDRSHKAYMKIYRDNILNPKISTILHESIVKASVAGKDGEIAELKESVKCFRSAMKKSNDNTMELEDKNTDLQAEVDHLRSHIAMLGMKIGTSSGFKLVDDKDTKLNKELNEFNKGFKTSSDPRMMGKVESVPAHEYFGVPKTVDTPKKRKLKIEIKDRCPDCKNRSDTFAYWGNTDRIICPVCHINFHPSMLQ